MRCPDEFPDLSIALELVGESGSYGHRMSAAAWENFHKATLELAKSTALKQRLTDAFSLYLQDMPASEMPGELRGDSESLRNRFTEVRPMRGETAVAATVR